MCSKHKYGGGGQGGGVNVSINWLLYKRVHISVKEDGAYEGDGQ